MTWTYTTREIAQALGATLPAGTDASIPCQGVSTDTRTLAPGQLFFALRGDNFDGNRFVAPALDSGAAAAVCSEPGPGPRIVVDDPLAALQRLAAHHRTRFHGPLLAITGSCGKTSAKDFTTALLSTRYRVVKTQGNLNNDIGCPLSLLRIGEDTEFAIIEMGANHPGEIAALCRFAQPTEAAVTMVGPAHLEGFGSVEEVARAKAEILHGLEKDGIFYVNTDDPHCRNMAETFPGNTVRFGSEGEVVLREAAYDDSGELALTIDPIGTLRLPLPLRAQAVNVLLATAVALHHGVTEFEAPLREACRASTRFRLERIGPLEVLDDAYNANPSSMRAALEAISERPSPGKRFAALGEMLELGQAAPALHQEIGRRAAELGIGRLYVRGPHACDMIQAARTAGIARAEAIDDPQAIAQAIYEEANPGDVLLLKGSRGMKMEGVLAALRTLYSSPPSQEEST